MQNQWNLLDQNLDLGGRLGAVLQLLHHTRDLTLSPSYLLLFTTKWKSILLPEVTIITDIQVMGKITILITIIILLLFLLRIMS